MILYSLCKYRIGRLICSTMGKANHTRPAWLSVAVREYSRIAPPQPATAEPVIRVTNNVAYLGSPKEGPKPRQLLSLPPFPGLPLPGKNTPNLPGRSAHVTAISWLKYYFDDVIDNAIQSYFNKGLVSLSLLANILFISFLSCFYFVLDI